MCSVCGCSEGETRIETLTDHKSPHAHGHEAGSGIGHAEAHTHAPTEPQLTVLRNDPAERAQLVSVEQDILSKNNQIAGHNRRHFAAHSVLALNLVSSPGAGKTTLLVDTLERMQDHTPVAVIEGDQETSADADRIRATGAPALQVNTGKGCHLDAEMIEQAFAALHIHDGVLFIENVGNLVCPAGFDLGEAHKVVIASVTEGEDKPLKYPNMFAASSLMLVSKVDLLPHLNFDVDALINNARKVNPSIGVLKVSSTTGEGMDAWLGWIAAARQMAAAAG
ncbi:MAG: hydrogenase nickel incorporation protein HypB [Pseudomonadota bacterium]